MVELLTMKSSIFFHIFKNNMGFKHYNGLKIVAVVGVIVAIATPTIAKYVKQHGLGLLFLLKLSAVLLVTVLVIALVFFLLFILFRLLFGGNTGTKEEHAEREHEERCIALGERAFDACRRASRDEAGYQKTWKKPKNTEVQQAIWGSHSVEIPNLFEILLTAWEKGERDTELALQLMYVSWDLGEQCYDHYTSQLRKLDEQTLIQGFQQPYEYLGGHRSENCTLLLTASHMISLFYYRTGLTFNDAEMCLKRFFNICPEGIPVAEFEGRGEFGDYFIHIIGHRSL